MTQDNANHDAVPAAIARTDADRNRTDKAAIRPGKGAGNTHPMQTTPGECSTPREGTEPVAFAVVFDSTEQIDCEFIYPDEATAGDVALDSNGSVVPLYRSPTLTDAEREAAEAAVGRAKRIGTEYAIIDAATLRGRGEEVEFLSSKEWIVRASNEIKRLRGIIDDYAAICAASSSEIAHLRSFCGVTKPLPDSEEAEDS